MIGPKPLTFYSRRRQMGGFCLVMDAPYVVFAKKKKRLWETKNLSTDADSSTDTKQILLVRQNLSKNYFFWPGDIKSCEQFKTDNESNESDSSDGSDKDGSYSDSCNK